MLFDLTQDIDRQTLVDMIQDYRDNIQPIITTELQKKNAPSPQRPVVEQTKFAWFSKDEIMEFLARNPESNGVRIYFASYPSSTVVEGENDKEKQGQLTIVLVPTETDENGTMDFNSPDRQMGTALNKGGICPTDCPRHGTKLLFP